MPKEDLKNKGLLKKLKPENMTYLGSTAGFQSKDKSKIYTVTSINWYRYLYETLKKKPTKAQAKILDKVVKKAPTPRCWGWLPNLKEAQRAVAANAGDMAECCYYTHAVIEEVGAGIPSMMFSDHEKTWWYEWHVDPKDPHKFRGQWVKCPKPKWAEGICGWGI